MGDSELQALGVKAEWIWGDDEETTVYAQAFGQGLTLIFRFTLDETQQPSNVVMRIVNCFHDRDIKDNDEQATFVDRAAMRKVLWPLLALAWPHCSKEATIKNPDNIIDIYQIDATKEITWKIHHDGLFIDYLNLLQPASNISIATTLDSVDFTSLIRHHQLGGRGCTSLVYKDTDPDTKYVFKGVDFRTFLNTYESGHAVQEVATFYRSIEVIANMPPHPNIMRPPLALVTLRKPQDEVELLCGTLKTFMPNGNVAEHIEKANKTGERVPLIRKARWCSQMVGAVKHTHHVAHTYHMDIKPGNFLVDDNDDLILIDWEQSDAPVSTAAPEIDGTWDVEELTNGKLIYTKYTGPERRNMPLSTPGRRGWNVWNVFPIWIESCPKAAELAEVFSLGRTMWMLLKQPDMESEDSNSSDDISENETLGNDIPDDWKSVVEACLKRDPNERLSLTDLLSFWEKTTKELEGQH